MHREHGHMNFPDTKRAVRRMSAIFPAPEKLVEDAANGPAVIADLTNEIPGLIPVKPDGGKFARVAAISGYVEAGNVYLPNPDLHSWVWKLLDEFSDVRAAVHDDDTDAMTQALARLFSGLARAGAPEFRVEPRLGEPATACHVSSEKIRPEWRKFGAISPGNALLLMAETPSGALRVWAEIDAFKIDAAELGKKLAEVAWPCLDAVMRFPFDILMPKEAFEPIEPIGCYAELLESGVLSWTPPNEDWQTRLAAPARLKAAKFRSEMVEQDDAAIDRLRSLLAFQPDDFKREEYSRGKALALRRDEGMEAYQNYMAAVEGVVRGEWPKLKISPACPRLISELGSFRTDLEPPPFVDALLLGVCAPRANKSGKVTEIPANEVQRALARIGRNPRPWARRRA
jgi:predicted phage terminase large subunit-like protein